MVLVVKNYDEAIEFYTKKLNFALVEDTKLSETKRWVRISPTKENDFTLLLAQAANEDQEKSVGFQTGGRVFLFMNTDDLQREYKLCLENDIKIIREPSQEDLYGNLWDVIEPKK
jgi:catechol 2,3-dioxygenase-like lactoylglutathione lyase family enzyme